MFSEFSQFSKTSKVANLGGYCSLISDLNVHALTQWVGGFSNLKYMSLIGASTCDIRAFAFVCVYTLALGHHAVHPRIDACTAVEP